MADKLLDDLHAETAAKPTQEAGIIHYLRGIAERLEDAFNSNAWNTARAIVAEVASRAPETATAVAAGTSAAPVSGSVLSGGSSSATVA